MSSINPNNINGQYPIAGQDNDSQGFRDNFTNVKNNLTFAKSEIEALEQNAILKTAIPGITLNNEMNNTQLKGVQALRFTETIKDVGSIGATTTVNWTEGHFQFLTLTQSTILSLTGWPTSQLYTRLRLQVTVSNIAFTLTLPTAIPLDNANVIQGCVSRVITFPSTGTYLFEFSSYDSGTSVTIQDLLRNYDINSTETSFSTIDVTGTTASTSSTTGVLKVAGGIGVVGNINAGGVIGASGNITTSGRFIGNITGNVIGNVTGVASSATVATTAGTVTTAAQPNITSVGTLTSVTSSGSILTTGASAGVGYSTGAGGAVVQGSGSGKNTTVTLNRPTGTITLDAASLAANATVAASFTLTNSTIAATDLVLIQHQSVGTLGGYTFAVTPAAGSAQILVRNVTQSALAEAIVLRFAVIKSVNA